MPPKGKKAATKKEVPVPVAKEKAKPEEKKVEKVEEKVEKVEEPIVEPVAKKAKTEENKSEEAPAEQDVEMKPQGEEEVKEKEKEKDAPKETRPLIKDAIGFDTSETSINVVPTTGGRVLLSLSDGGMQFLLAGARANTGIRANRYFYEVKILEALTPSEAGHGGRGRVPMPRQLARVGFSTAGSSLILGDGDGGVCFDSEGFFLGDKKRNQVSQKFGRDHILGVLLNLDPKSPNANTISLFCNGERISEPQALPEQLKGKALFPHVCFRNVTVQVHFGPQCMKALPFKCRMLQEAAKADVEVMKPSTPKDGKYEVIFPVAFPDEGTFDWLDGFLEKNPQYVELSDRKVLEWAVKSGIWRPKSNSWKNSNDKPDFNFGIPAMDDMSAQRTINSVAPVAPRNYVVMEVKQNLVQADRQENLKRFSAPHFKKIAHVVMGEPSAEYKKLVHKKLLEEKQAKADAEWKMKKLEKERKKQIDKRQKQFAEMQKKALEAKQKEEEAAKK